MKLKSEYDKELAEVIAQMNHKYEAKHQDAEAAFQLKTKEVDICFNRVIMNKVLADIYRSKCQDMTPFKPAEIQSMISSLKSIHLSQLLIVTKSLYYHFACHLVHSFVGCLFLSHFHL